MGLSTNPTKVWEIPEPEPFELPAPAEPEPAVEPVEVPA